MTTTPEASLAVADAWSCGICGDNDVPHKFRVFGICYKCAARKSIDKRNRKIELLQSRLSATPTNESPAPQATRNTMTVDADLIRQIVREELAKQQPAPVAPSSPPQRTYETGNRRYVREEDCEDNSEGA